APPSLWQHWLGHQLLLTSMSSLHLVFHALPTPRPCSSTAASSSSVDSTQPGLLWLPPRSSIRQHRYLLRLANSSSPVPVTRPRSSVTAAFLLPEAQTRPAR